MLSMFHGLLWSIQVERCGDYAFWLARQICLGEGWCLDHSMNWRDFVQTDPFDPLCLSLDCVQPQRDLGGTMANLWNQADLDKAEFEKKSAPWPPWRSLGRTREASFLTPPNPDLTMPDANSKMRLSTVSGIWADFGKYGLLGSCKDTEEKWIEMDILAEYTKWIYMILAHIDSVFTHYFTKRSLKSEEQIWCLDLDAEMQKPTCRHPGNTMLRYAANLNLYPCSGKASKAKRTRSRRWPIRCEIHRKLRRPWFECASIGHQRVSRRDIPCQFSFEGTRHSYGCILVLRWDLPL